VQELVQELVLVRVRELARELALAWDEAQEQELPQESKR
jgi:hypothetical protein